MGRIARRVITAALLLLGCAAPLSSGRSPAFRPEVAILGIPEEIEPLIRTLSEPRREQTSAASFVLGYIGETPAAVGASGIGKVNAAVAAATVIHQYQPRFVLFSGTSGAVNPSLSPGDLIIGTTTVQHDFGRQRKDGYDHWRTKNPVTGQHNPLFIPADAELLGAAMDAACHLELQPVPLDTGTRIPVIIQGRIGTGDTFVADAARAAELRAQLGIDAVEMEGAAVAQVCRQQRVPCLVIRSISDKADGSAPRDYARFIKLASANSAALVRAIVVERERLEREERRLLNGSTQVWELSFELPFGSGSPYSRRFPDLLSMSYQRQSNIAEYVFTRLVRSAAATVGLNRVRFSVGPGIYPGTTTHPSAVLRVHGNARQVSNLACAIGYLAQQTEVLAFAPSRSGDLGAVEITWNRGSPLATPSVLDQFCQWLEKRQPRLAQGFMPLLTGTKRGIRIVDLGRRWRTADDAPFSGSIHAAGAAVRAPVTIRWKRVYVNDYCNPWGLTSDGQRYLFRIGGTGVKQIRSRLAQISRKQAENWIQEALSRGPAQPITRLPKSVRRGTGARFRYRWR